MLVESWLARAAAQRPQRPALQTPAEDWSYAQLYAAARFGAGALAARGAGPGVRVAIALPAGLAFAQALHACLLLGAVAVPVDLRLAAREQARILDGAGVLVSEPLGEGPVPGALPVDLRHDLDAVAVVIHTSGTTAAPRPVELTYGNLLWSALGSAVALGIGEDERWLCALTLAHVGGLSILVRAAIRSTTAIIHERFEVDRVLYDLSAREATGVSLVATTLARLLDAGLRRPEHLRCALTGGGPVPAALVARAREAGVPVGLTYGLSQAASQVTTTPLVEIMRGLDGDGDGDRSAGPPLFCTRVRIAADDEILVRGPTVAPGTLGPDGWLHTGDLGGLDDRGRLLVTGRKVDTIVSGGENIAPAEVEAVLEAHPQVLEAAVLARADPRWGEAVTAIVLARAGATPDPETLRAHCAAALAPFKVPKRFEFASEPLPRTSSGKLLRRELQ
jgi:O-succinylbenzoic acid--CoA ligase